jgi:hypothetical protein
VMISSALCCQRSRDDQLCPLLSEVTCVLYDIVLGGRSGAGSDLLCSRPVGYLPQSCGHAKSVTCAPLLRFGLMRQILSAPNAVDQPQRFLTRRHLHCLSSQCCQLTDERAPCVTRRKWKCVNKRWLMCTHYFSHSFTI